MKDKDKIFVIEKNLTNKIKVKGSQFIGFAKRIISAEDAINKLELLKKEYYDATHHCYAYKLISGDEKYSDDGEPNGTAGIRILNAINHYNLVNILLVIVRYFGGTKLGIGPLGKAYGNTAMLLLKEADISTKLKYEKISIQYSYNLVSNIHQLMNKYECKKIKNLFDKNPVIECLIQPKNFGNFKDELINKTSGNILIKPTKQYFYLNLY